MKQSKNQGATKPIRLVLVSGFLGAGKTTLLQALLKQYRHQKLGVLVNEFGSLGVDGIRLNQTGITLVEINNGSVFCACLKDGFVRALQEFSAQPIDLLFIECSGMADPIGMNVLMEGLTPYLTRAFDYQGSVCLVDCTTYLDYVDVMVAVQNQVASADLILVNKTDLVDAQTLAQIHSSLRELNPDASLYNTLYAQLPQNALEDHLQNHGRSGRTSNTCDSRPATYLLSTNAGCTRAQLKAFYQVLEGKILRLKGYLPGEGGWWEVDGVTSQLIIQEIPSSPFQAQDENKGQLVLISCGREDISALITEAWQSQTGCKAKLEAT